MDENVCRYNKFGFCRFGNECFRKHINIICENVNCQVTRCSLRHPSKCRYFLQYLRCKFGDYCRFSHAFTDNPNLTEEIRNIKKELKDLKSKTLLKEQEIQLKDNDIKELEKTQLENVFQIEKKNKEMENEVFKNKLLDDKIEEIKEENNTLKNKLEDAIEKNKVMGKTIEEMETAKKSLEVAINSQYEKLSRMKDIEQKSKIMEKILKENEIEKTMFESTIQSKDEEIEVIRKQIKYTANKIEADTNDTVDVEATDEKEDNSCYKCNFIGKTKADLKTHVLTKHKVSILRKYS